MAIYIVNFQNFKTLINEIILKEVAIVSIHSNVEYHWMIRPPTRYSNLEKELRKRVDYITDYIHGIPWNIGYVEQRDVLENMKKILRDASCIYIKGSERVQYIKFLMRDYPYISVLDLDNFIYCIQPNNNKIPNFECPYNKPRHNNKSCALELATRHRNILRRELYSVFI